MAIPALLLSLQVFFRKILNNASENILKRIVNILYFFFPLSFVYVWFVSKQSDFLYTLNNYFLKNIYLSIPLFILIFLLIKFSPKINFKGKAIYAIDVTALIFIIVILYKVSLLSIFSIDIKGAFETHFSAVIHSVVQVYFGKALLVDLTNQYGLYPHFIEPIFKIFGLSIFKFSFLMTFMTVLAFFLIYLFLRQVVKNKIILFLGFLFLLFYGYFFIKLLGFDPYYQYHPIRFFFPAISIFLTYQFIKSNSKFLYYLLFFFYSVAVLWNSETGIVVFIAWSLLLVFIELFEKDKKQIIFNIISHMIKGIMIFCGTFLIYIVYIKLRYGSFPNFIKFFEYQRLFYQYGYYMMPMKLLHTWNLVFFMYILGLATSARSLRLKIMNNKQSIIFYISLLGVGLFTYYQGRSHDYNLTAVWYPALILLVVYIDKLWKIVIKADKKNIVSVVTLVGALYLFSSASISLALKYPDLDSFKNKFKATPTPMSENADFIRERVANDKQAVIISYHEGIYHLMSNTSSPIKMPGLAELNLKSDFEKIIKYIKNNDVKIFLDLNVYEHFPKNYWTKLFSKLLHEIRSSNYAVKDVSKNGDIFFLKRTKYKNNQSSIDSLLKYKDSDQLHFKECLNGAFYVDISNNKIIGYRERFQDEVFRKKVYLKKDFYIEILIKPQSKQVDYANILGNHPGKDHYYIGFVIQQDVSNQNKYTFSYGNGKEWLPSASFGLNPKEWNYLVVVVHNNFVNVYNNAQINASQEIGDSIKNSDMPIFIGKWYFDGRQFNGSIKEGKISNGTISDREITSNWLAIKDKLNNLNKNKK